MRRLPRLALILGIWSALSGCTTGAERTRCVDRRIVMGCEATIVTYAVDSDAARAATRQAFETMARIEDALSDYRPRSEAMRAVREVGIWHEVGPDLQAALVESDRWRRWSGGALDPAIGATTGLWREARRRGTPPSAEARVDAARASGWSLVEFDRPAARVRILREGVRLDFGAIGKGIAADAAIQVLRSAGFPKSLVDVGGDVVVGSPPPGRQGWSIDIEGPEGATVRTIELAHGAVATSGDRHQHIDGPDGDRLSHIIDARTLDPVVGAGLVTVIVGSADGAATAADAIASIASVLDAAALLDSASSGVEARILIQRVGAPCVEIRLDRGRIGAE